MTRILLITLIGASLAAAAPAVADSRQGNDQTRDPSFSGSCQFAGTIMFRPALTDMPQTVTDTARASGICTGRLTDKSGREQQLNNAPVTYLASDRGNNASCAGATATGDGTLVFANGRIDFALTETRAGGVANLSLTGSKGGSAQGLATLSPSDNPITLAQECTASGIAQVDVDIALSTTPSISG